MKCERNLMKHDMKELCKGLSIYTIVGVIVWAIVWWFIVDYIPLIIIFSIFVIEVVFLCGWYKSARERCKKK